MLIVEDDRRLMQCLARAMDARGFKVMIAGSVCDGLAQIQLSAPEYAVVDLRFDDGCGLDVVSGAQTTSARGTRHHSDWLRQYRDGRKGSKARRRRLSHETCGCG